MRGRQRLALVAAGMVALVGIAGCSAGSDDSDAGGAGFADQQSGPESGAGRAEGAPPAEEGAPDDGGVAGGAVFDTRSIIYTGAITVRVADVDEAAAAATAVAERYGGFIGGDRRSDTGDADQAQATLVLRIPAGDFTAAVTDLAELGEEESRGIETEDVTEEVVDLETRIATAAASVERTRVLLERADSIEDIVAVEAELSEREAALASLQARQRRLADLTTLSTITATLLAQEASPEPEDDDRGFLAGLVAGWDAFTTSVTVLLTGLGALLPWLVAVGVPTATGVWWNRRRRALRAAPIAIDPPAGPPGA